MRFCIGQSVRVLFAMTQAGQRHVGREAVIVEVMEFFESIGYGLDIAPIYFNDELHSWAVWNEMQLSPAVPPGLESLDRINELYEPEPEVIRV